MLISRSRKFLFIHIQKTGGRSLSHLLKAEAPDTQPYLGTHDHAFWAKHLLANEWNDYFKFAFVRNPWDRLVSWYVMIMQKTKRYHEMHRGNVPLRLWQYVLGNSSNFEEFILNCTKAIDDIDGKKSFVYNQLDYISDECGDIIVDYVGKYETLEADVEHVLHKLGLNYQHMPHLNKSRRQHYSYYYTTKTRDIVAARYERDIEFFGYEFENPKPKS